MDVVLGWFGLDLIETQIVIAAPSHLGHLGRYSRERWEVGALGAELRDGPGTFAPDSRRITLRSWYWQQIQLLMKFSSKPEPPRHKEWFHLTRLDSRREWPAVQEALRLGEATAARSRPPARGEAISRSTGPRSGHSACRCFA
eukprot:8112023-Pyramimonas_sp.AAC.1